jgi:hypothetical protein
MERQVANGIYKRGEGQWLVRIRERGKKINRTFETFDEADEFRKMTVGKITGRTYVDTTKEERTTLKMVLQRYKRDVTPTKAGAAQEGNRIEAWCREKFAEWPLVSITAADIVEWRDSRVAEGKAPSTIANSMNILSAVYKKAISEWGFRVENPCRGLARPKARPARDDDVARCRGPFACCMRRRADLACVGGSYRPAYCHASGRNSPPSLGTHQ